MGIILFLYILGSIGYIVYLFIDGSTKFFSILKIFGLLTVVFVVLCFIKSLLDHSKWNKQFDDYKKQYNEALKGTDKQKALEFGRRYYRHVRPWDEANNEIKIANDISCMNT